MQDQENAKVCFEEGCDATIRLLTMLCCCKNAAVPITAENVDRIRSIEDELRNSLWTLSEPSMLDETTQKELFEKMPNVCVFAAKASSMVDAHQATLNEKLASSCVINDSVRAQLATDEAHLAKVHDRLKEQLISTVNLVGIALDTIAIHLDYMKSVRTTEGEVGLKRPRHVADVDATQARRDVVGDELPQTTGRREFPLSFLPSGIEDEVSNSYMSASLQLLLSADMFAGPWLFNSSSLNVHSSVSENLAEFIRHFHVICCQLQAPEGKPVNLGGMPTHPHDPHQFIITLTEKLTGALVVADGSAFCQQFMDGRAFTLYTQTQFQHSSCGHRWCNERVPLSVREVALNPKTPTIQALWDFPLQPIEVSNRTCPVCEEHDAVHAKSDIMQETHILVDPSGDPPKYLLLTISRFASKTQMQGVGVDPLVVRPSGFEELTYRLWSFIRGDAEHYVAHCSKEDENGHMHYYVADGAKVVIVSQETFVKEADAAYMLLFKLTN